MIDPGSIYLKNLAKRVVEGEHVYTSEIVNAPKVLDKVYGDGNGHLDFSDVDDIASNVGSEIAEAASNIWDFVLSIF